MRTHGSVAIPKAVTEHAERIKHENYRVNTPEKFQVRSLAGGEELMEGLAGVIDLPRSKLDFVYFSVASGAEPHTDKLNPSRFEDTTFVIPVILPRGRSIIRADDGEVTAEVGAVYEFDHTRTHSMTVEDSESGCVVIMVAVKR